MVAPCNVLALIYSILVMPLSNLVVGSFILVLFIVQVAVLVAILDLVVDSAILVVY